MGEEAKKADPKVQKKKFYRRGNSQQATPKKETYKAPSKGIEEFIFTYGTPNDATNFTKTKETLIQYIGGSSLYKHGTEYALNAMKRLEEPTFPDPPDPAPPVDPANPTFQEKKEQMKWESAVKQQILDQQAWKDVRVKMYNLVMQHATPNLEDAMKADTEWDTVSGDYDVIGLLKLIRSFAHKHNDVLDGTVLAVNHDIEFYLQFQKESQSLDDFQTEFKAKADVIDTYGGKAGYHPGVYLKHRKKFAEENNLTLQQLTKEQNEKCLAAACEEYKAALFVRQSNAKKYGNAKSFLDNAHLMKTGEYPVTVEGAVRILKNYKGEQSLGSRNYRSDRGGDYQGVAFGELGGNQLGPCDGCGKMGHLVRTCRETSKEKKMEIYQAKAAGTFTRGQAHMEMNDQGNEDDDGMGKCMDGVANIQMALEEASIETADGAEDVDIFEGIGLHVSSTVKAKSERLGLGEDKLYLDSCASNNTMCSTKHLERLHMTKVYLRQNCNAARR